MNIVLTEDLRNVGLTDNPYGSMDSKKVKPKDHSNYKQTEDC